jgi:hypothetical protein
MDKLIANIDKALIETEQLVSKSNFYTRDKEPIKSTVYVLTLLKEEVEKGYEKINIRVLRAMHDLGMSSYKDFENTPLEDALNNVISILYNDIPGYKILQPLRMDFGKGNPI